MNSTELLTGVLVLVTGYYAIQTRKTVQAMNEANEANNRPIVSVGIQDRIESVSFLDLYVTNAGRGLARDIKFKVVGDDIEINAYTAEGKQKLSNYTALRNGIKALAPNETRKYWLISVMGRAEELRKAETYIKVTYTNNDGNKKYSDKFILDFSSLPEGRLGDDPTYRLSKEAEKIRKELEKLVQEVKSK